MMLISSFKWAKNDIVSLTASKDAFEIVVLFKNIRTVYNIAKSDLFAKIEWRGGRPSILVLTLFDKETKIADFYSGGSSDKVIVLEDIYYLISKGNLMDI